MKCRRYVCRLFWRATQLGDFTVRTLRSSLLVVLVLCIGLGAAQARNVNVPEAKPETVGFSSERLKRLDAGMKAIVDNKQLAGVATMTLYEEGKWKPSDPISRHIPEFKDLKVFKSLGADGKPVAELPGHPP